MKYLLRSSVIVLVITLVFPLAMIYAQEPAPSSYEEVALYSELEAATASAGDQALQLFIDGELETLHDLFSAELQAGLTIEQLEAGRTAMMEPVPLGARLDYFVFASTDGCAYFAQHEYGDEDTIMLVGYNAAGEITNLVELPDPGVPEDPAGDYESTVMYRLPFDGLWFTLWGGANDFRNFHHVPAPSQRHAFDFVIWKDGNSFAGDGTALTDYFAYGQPILAPAAGEVIATENTLPDMLPAVETDDAHPMGNYVALQIAEGEYLFIAHMQPGSVAVEVGDVVEAGQMLGRVGNSGNTSEPHIHIHLQDQPVFYTYDDAGNITGQDLEAVGLPLNFSNYLANGQLVERSEPLSSEFVQNMP